MLTISTHTTFEENEIILKYYREAVETTLALSLWILQLYFALTVWHSVS